MMQALADTSDKSQHQGVHQDERDEARYLRTLELYAWCRRMRLTQAFMDALGKPQHLCFHKLFRDALPRGVQDYLNHTEWCIERWLLRRDIERSDSSLFVKKVAARSLSDRIISFLTASHVSAPPPPARRQQPLHCRLPIASAPFIREEGSLTPRPSLLAAMPNSPQALRGSLTPPPQRKRDRDDTAEQNTPEHQSSLPPGKRGEFVSSLGGELLLTPSRSMTAAPVGGCSAPLFFVSPPYNGVTTLFARMLTSSALNDEELNRYFGRYGQVSSTKLRVRKVVVRDGKIEALSEEDLGGGIRTSMATSFGGVNASEDRFTGRGSMGGGTSARRRGFLDDGSSAVQLLQDFHVVVDLAANALGAISELRHPHVVFVAPSAEERNEYWSEDIDLCMPVVVPWINPEMALNANIADDDDLFVPELVIENIPYWHSPDQITAYCSVYGEVNHVRLSIDDRSGAFTGAALLQMSTVEETVKAANGLNGKILEGDGDEASVPLICGVLDTQLNIVSLLDENVVLRAASHRLVERVTDNPRLWL